MQHYSYFRKEISGPIVGYGCNGAGKEALLTLQHQVLNRVLLRRTKAERKNDLQLPSISTFLRKVELSAEERDFYESLYEKSQLQFSTYANSGTLLYNYAHIFDLLTSLRQAVNHPFLIVYGQGSALPSKGAADPGQVLCVLCQDTIVPACEDEEDRLCRAKCGHAFHKGCIQSYMEDAPRLPEGGIGCPSCFDPLTVSLEEKGSLKPTGSVEDSTGLSLGPCSEGLPEMKNEVKDEPVVEVSSSKKQDISRKVKVGQGPASREAIVNKFKVEAFVESAKIKGLVEELQAMREEDADAKGLVFSQFTRMLDLVEFALKRRGIQCAKLTGSSTLSQKNAILHAFNKDKSIKVLLISLKAGGEGLNLQVANHVFLLDPWWNPACELQAIQRAHRIGQMKPVKAVRLVARGTVEEKILAIQKKKQLVFDGTIGRAGEALAKLDEDDLKSLFMN